MAKKISLKKALLMSGLSMAVCSAMLVGTTFAWFSSTAESGVNTIVAGNLKVALQDEAGTDLKEKPLFEDVVWEPGVMVVSDSFKVVNEGSLALQYALSVHMDDEVKTADGHGLSEVIQYKVVAANGVPATLTDADREDVWGFTRVTTTGVLEAEAESDLLAVVLYWEPTDHDNDYNVEPDEDALETNFSVSVYATQTSFEEDSFGDKYDQTVLGDLLLKSDTILGHDLYLEGVVAYSGIKATLDLNGYNINSTEDPYAAIWLQSGADVTINGNGVVSAAADGSYSVYVLDNAKVTINGGEYMQGVYAQTWSYAYQTPAVTINGGTYHGYVNAGNGATEAVIVINGGDFTDAAIEKIDIESGRIVFSEEWLAQWDLIEGKIEAGHYTAVAKS